MATSPRRVREGNGSQEATIVKDTGMPDRKPSLGLPSLWLNKHMEVHERRTFQLSNVTYVAF